MKMFPFGMYMRYAEVYGLAMALMALALPALDAQAKEARVHASACRTEGGVPAAHHGTLANNSSSNAMLVYYPIADTDSFRKQDIYTLNIHGHNGTSERKTLARACVAYWGMAGGSCDVGVASDYGSQEYTLKPFLNVWNSVTVNDFGYLYISVPPQASTGAVSIFRGYFTHGN